MGYLPLIRNHSCVRRDADSLREDQIAILIPLQLPERPDMRRVPSRLLILVALHSPHIAIIVALRDRLIVVLLWICWCKSVSYCIECPV